MFLGNDSAKGDHYKTLEGAFMLIGMWNFQFKVTKQAKKKFIQAKRNVTLKLARGLIFGGEEISIRKSYILS